MSKKNKGKSEAAFNMEENKYGIKFKDLRTKAEEVLAEKGSSEKQALEIDELIHELQVHQIELEMQNEELRRAQIELQNSQNKYYELYNFAPTSYFTLDEKELIKNVNLEGAALLGVEKSNLINSAFIYFIAPDSRNKFSKLLKLVIGTGISQKFELKLLKNKQPFHALLEINSGPYKGGRLKSILITAVDITERKKMEEDLRHSNEWLGFAQHSAKSGFWDWDMLTEKLTWSKELYTLFNLPVTTEASFKNWLELIHPDDRQLAMDNINRAIKEQKFLENEYRIIHPDGKEIWILALGSTSYDKEENPQRMSGICLDITERKKAEKIMKESLFELDISNKVTMQMVDVANTSEIYSIIGKAVKDLLPDSYVIVSGISPDEKNVRIMEILGQNYLNKITNIMGIDPYKLEFSVDDISKKDLKKHQTEILTEYKDGFYNLTMKKIPLPVCRMIEKVFHIGEVHSIRFSFEGHHYGGVSIALLEGQSLQHKKTIETLVNQASIVIRRSRAEKSIKESLAEKNVLLREIHHRVKNNMQIISSLLNLQSQFVEGKETVDILKESQGRVKSMAMIHEKLYHSPDMGHLNFKEYIEKLVSDIFFSYGAYNRLIKPIIRVNNVEMSMETAIPCGLIINELVTNSIKYAFPEGRDGEVHISLKDKGEQFVLTISDNGIGFPEDLDFQNTESLGLQLVNSLTDQIDGKIKLDKSHGTEFKITFKELEYKERI